MLFAAFTYKYIGASDRSSRISRGSGAVESRNIMLLGVSDSYKIRHFFLLFLTDNA
jgi:hypothetical protein